MDFEWVGVGFSRVSGIYRSWVGRRDHPLAVPDALSFSRATVVCEGSVRDAVDDLRGSTDGIV